MNENWQYTGNTKTIPIGTSVYEFFPGNRPIKEIYASAPKNYSIQVKNDPNTSETKWYYFNNQEIILYEIANENGQTKYIDKKPTKRKAK